MAWNDLDCCLDAHYLISLWNKLFNSRWEAFCCTGQTLQFLQSTTVICTFAGLNPIIRSQCVSFKNTKCHSCPIMKNDALLSVRHTFCTLHLVCVWVYFYLTLREYVSSLCSPICTWISFSPSFRKTEAFHCVNCTNKHVQRIINYRDVLTQQGIRYNTIWYQLK